MSGQHKAVDTQGISRSNEVVEVEDNVEVGEVKGEVVDAVGIEVVEAEIEEHLMVRGEVRGVEARGGVEGEGTVSPQLLFKYGEYCTWAFYAARDYFLFFFWMIFVMAKSVSVR